jgi:protein-L-isoaspartate(D-aspartate) O-methyltransferase
VSKHDFQAMRAAMIASQLRTNNVSDPRITDAMETVAREAFVPEERAALAYVDVAVPLGGGRALNPPLATARLISEAQLRAGDRVLLVGAATGYAASVLSSLVAHVTALEEDSALAAKASALLSGNPRISIVNGPFTKGWQDTSPYDAIIIDGAVAEPGAEIIAQLGQGGRLVAGLADRGVTRLVRGVKAGDYCTLVPFADVETVILPGFDKPAGFAF